jgi:hypothetical protein
MGEHRRHRVAAGRMIACLPECANGYDAQQERTGIRPVGVKETLNYFRVILAAFRSQKTGKAVRV